MSDTGLDRDQQGGRDKEETEIVDPVNQLYSFPGYITFRP